jgi:hypothetical protein
MTRFALLQTVLSRRHHPLARDVWEIQVTLRAAHVDAVDVQELSRRDEPACSDLTLDETTLQDVLLTKW